MTGGGGAVDSDDRAGERSARIVLAHAIEPGDEAAGRLLGRLGAAELLDRVHRGSTGLRSGEGLAARVQGVEPGTAEGLAAAIGARIVTPGDPEWPTQVDALGAAAPVALWVSGAGDLRLLALRSVAVVGARACTPYGEEVARSWSVGLAGEGWTVVSGAAFGIDAAAHRGALAAQGVTMAVVAGGVDVPYPRAHAALLAAIVDDGLVVSETPPGLPVRRQRFLSRNRLIAALTRATLVVEAADRSGTAATARVASALSRPVLAVPGPVTSPTSAGCHRMIRDGDAVLVCDLADLRGLLDLGRVEVVAPLTGARDRLGARERRVLDALPTRGVTSLEDLVRAAGLGAADVLSAAGLLVAAGWVSERPGGWSLTRR